MLEILIIDDLYKEMNGLKNSHKYTVRYGTMIQSLPTWKVFADNNITQ